jgi:hypothetical protein
MEVLMDTSCPVCGGAMARGKSVIRKSTMAWLSWPWASDRLEFAADGADPKEARTPMRQGSPSESFRCGHCGALLVTGKVWYPR